MHGLTEKEAWELRQQVKNAQQAAKEKREAELNSIN